MTRFLPILLLGACSGRGPIETDSGVPTDTDAGVDITEVDAPTCAQPGLRASTGPFSRHTMADTTPAREAYVYGGGIVAQDFDSDGQHELVTIRDRTAEVLDWDGSTWVAKPERMPPGLTPDDLDFGFGAAAADLDEDGDLDLHVTRWSAPNQVWLNDGAGAFSLAPGALGLAGPPTHHSGASTFADLDGDGDLDLLVAGHGFIDEESADPEQFAPGDDTLVYINQNDTGGGWVLQTDRLPDDAHAGYSFMGGLIDFDVDGDPDLMLINDFGRRFRAGMLLWNDGDGHFTADNNAVGLDLAVAGMGLGVAEINGDGRPDVLVPFWGGYAYMLSAGSEASPIWADFTAVSFLTPALSENQTVGWGAQFGDLDNDTLDDAIVMHGYIETNISQNTPTQPDALFRQLPDRWDNVTRDWDQIDTGDGRGLVIADLDGDGWLDYARPDLSGATRVYMGRCGTASWLSVALDQPGRNPRAIGAVLEARVPGRDAPMTRYVLGGGIGLGSDVPAEQHFGLGDATAIDLTITWPDGERTEVPGLQANRRLRIRRR